MELSRITGADHLEIRVKGRLDSHWAKTLADELGEAVRGGAHHIRLNCSELHYVSSAGIRVLVRAMKDIKSIQGSFYITQPSEVVKSTLAMGGLSGLLQKETPSVLPGQTEPVTKAAICTATESATWETHDVTPTGAAGSAGFNCIVRGKPFKLASRSFASEDCARVEFPPDKIGLGLGAFGESFEESSERFGEFLAIGGSAACLPGDGTKSVDYSLSRGALVPKVQMLYGLECRGAFTQLSRFETKPDNRGTALSEIVDSVLTSLKTDHAVVAILAETAGLVGAYLRKSPVSAASLPVPVAIGAKSDDEDEYSSGGGTRSASAKAAPVLFKDSGGNILDFPQVREWIALTSERGYARTLSLAVGVISRKPDAPGASPTGAPPDGPGTPVAASPRAATLAPLLRPLGKPGAPPVAHGHFHAAVFSYRPLKKGKLDLAATVHQLFEEDTAQALLHLLQDSRDLIGAGESEFIRGAVWAAPVTGIWSEGNET